MLTRMLVELLKKCCTVIVVYISTMILLLLCKRTTHCIGTRARRKIENICSLRHGLNNSQGTEL